MVMERYFREALLALFLLMGFTAMNVWGAASHGAPGSTGLKINISKTYFDRFREAVEDEIQVQLSKTMKVPASQLSVSLEALRISPTLPDLKVYSVQVLGLGTEGSNRLDGMVTLTVMVGDGRSPVELSLSGLMKVVGPVVLARQVLPRGRLIGVGDLETKILPWKNLPTGAAGIVETALLGRRVKAFINSGAPVWAGMLEEQVAIRSGDQVEITVLSGPGVIIHSRGVARGEGRVGEVIRIEQPDTRKILPATVVGDKAVEVRL